MKLSILSVVDHYPELARDVGQFYDELIDQAVLADRLGYQACFIAEHHFHPYGVVPNPAVILAAIAQRTDRILLGPSVAILPFRDPRLVAEDYAMLDLLSHGRLVLGLGSGYLKHEFAGFGREPTEKRERFDDGMAIVKRLIAGERVSFQGRFDQLDGVQLNVLPAQRVVPVYVAALTKEAAYYIGRQGNGLLTIPYGTLNNLDEMAPLAASFERGRAESGASPMPHGLAPHIATFHTHVARSETEAEAAVRGPFELYCRTRLYAKPWSYEQIRANGLALFGSVESVAHKLIALGKMGVTSVNTMGNFGAMPPEAVHSSMRLMIEEVLPRVEATLKERE
jgi:alkanesulfonate monooxygenase SsuD/methylene tetrahydromethanopterin reductase-like flavin-dependent oxidoreductase (luciferase family)